MAAGMAKTRGSNSATQKDNIMIPSLTYPPKINTTTKPRQISSGINRIFAAAVVNRQFCELLLHEPSTALKVGYLGESFLVTNYEREIILSTRAETLADFAKQINKALKDQ